MRKPARLLASGLRAFLRVSKSQCIFHLEEHTRRLLQDRHCAALVATLKVDVNVGEWWKWQEKNYLYSEGVKKKP